MIATDLVKEAFASENGALDGGIVGNHAAGNWKRGLEDRDGGEVRDGQLVREAVAVRIGAEAKTLLGLHAVVVIHGVVGELAKGNDGAGLMIRKDEQARRSSAAGLEAWRGKASDLRSVPAAVGVVRENAERDALGDEAAGGTWKRGGGDGLQVGGHLPRHHFEKAGAVHADGLAVIGGV